MKKRILYILTCTVLALFLGACGETGDDISFGSDHEVPAYKVLNDSLEVQTLQEVQLNVEISDNKGIQKLLFSYGNWSINKVIYPDGNPTKYSFVETIKIPENAEKVWKEQVIRNDGTVETITQTYHKLTITATDVNMNTRIIPIYIKVK